MTDSNHVSYFVEAGAGSGKTTKLVSRMVSMVEEGVDVSEICAITFTKAAAAEFYSRFQERLIERSVDSEIDSRKRDYCQNALENIDLCFMGTIDSFCNMLIREHPAEAGVPSDTRLIDENEQAILLKREFKQIQNGEYGEELKKFSHRFILVTKGYMREDKFVKLMQTLLERRDTDFVLPSVPDDPDTFLSGKTGELHKLVSALCDHPYAECDATKGIRAAWDMIKRKSERLLSPWKESDLIEFRGDLKTLREIAINADFDINLLGPAVAGMFEEHYNRRPKIPKLDRYVLGDETKEWIQQLMESIDEYDYMISLNFVAQCMPLIAESLCSEGSFTYFDYKLHVRDMLKRDAEGDGTLIRHISKRHKYYLLDEFQDTDPMQFEIFFYLAAEEPVSDWRKCTPRPGALFVVGDPKQSIYRFKGANIASYLSVKELFDSEDAVVLPLVRNYRSDNVLKRWFNETFTELLPKDTADQSRFEDIPIDPSEEDTTDSFKGVYRYDWADADPEAMAAMIHHLVYHDNVLIRVYDKEEKAFKTRPVEYGDIMLITRKKSELATYMKKFYERNIPCRVEGNLVFGECPALILASEVYKAIALPNDTRWFYKVLRSKLFGITEKQIGALKNKDKEKDIRISIYSAIPDDWPDTKVREAFAKLNDDYLVSLGMTPSALLSRIVEKYDLFSCVGTDNLEYLYYALELLCAQENSGAVASLQDGADYLDSLLKGDSDVERCIGLVRNSNCVHLANLHKVKGLEAPVVILAAGTYKEFDPGNRSEYTGGKARSWFFKVMDNEKHNYQLYCQTQQYPVKSAEERESAKAEHDRLLYVAATRAKNALIIGGLVGEDGNTIGSNYWEPLLEHCKDDLYDSISDNDSYDPDPATIDIETLYKSEEVIALTDKDCVAGKTYKGKTPSTLPKVKTKSEKDDTDAADVTRDRTHKGNAAVMGSMVHRFMEAIVSSRSSREKADPAVLITEIIENFSDEITPGVDYQGILKGVADTILNGGYGKQESGVPTDILSELLSAEEVHCELPFCYKEESATKAGPVIWNGIIDVAYKKDGAWHILDYKTNYENDNLGETFKPQLDQYVKAFRAITGEEADAMIYSIPV